MLDDAKNKSCDRGRFFDNNKIPLLKTASLRAVSLLIAGAVCAHSSFAQFPMPQLPFNLPGVGNPANAAAIASLVVYIIQKREASERQKQIADARARRAYANMSPKRKAALKAKRVRYIAVDTEKNEKTSPQAKKSVMVWDTQSQEIAGGDVYDVKRSPKVGETAKFDRYSAEYVGSGT